MRTAIVPADVGQVARNARSYTSAGTRGAETGGRIPEMPVLRRLGAYPPYFSPNSRRSSTNARKLSNGVSGGVEWSSAGM